MASALADSTAVYDADNDPDFVRLAAPSTLKTVEMLLSQQPHNLNLLLTACSGFTEYSYAFLQVEAELQPDAQAAKDLRTRAGKMYQRARGYCLDALHVRDPRITLDALAHDPRATLERTEKRDVPLLYWTGASWAADLSTAPNQLGRAGELVAVRALLQRAKALDPTWQEGAIYEALIAIDGLPALVGGNATAAKADFDRAVQLSNGHSVFAYVAYALTLQNAAARRPLLEKAVAIDTNAAPARRLPNLIAQRYARALLSGAARSR